MDYFNVDEIKCNCCGQYKVDEQFLFTMNLIRYNVGQPLYINSWYRCQKHDDEVGGKGNHVTGAAVDIKIDSSTLRYLVIEEALHAGIERIGIGKGFIHLDTVEEAPQEVAWLYV